MLPRKVLFLLVTTVVLLQKHMLTWVHRFMAAKQGLLFVIQNIYVIQKEKKINFDSMRQILTRSIIIDPNWEKTESGKWNFIIALNKTYQSDFR